MTNDDALRQLAQQCIDLPDGLPVTTDSRRYAAYLQAATPARILALLAERDALRAALDAYQVALVETMQRATNGYDWNADPDHITRLQGAASAAAEAACEALFQALAKETPNA